MLDPGEAASTYMRMARSPRERIHRFRELDVLSHADRDIIRRRDNDGVHKWRRDASS